MKSRGDKTSKTTSGGAGKKRKFHATGRDSKHRSSSSHPAIVLQNPKRGAPGFLMTCEQGKEQKCQREGLQMIQYYFDKKKNQQEDKDNQESQPKKGEISTTHLSLEEELKQLQETKGDGSPSNFGIFQTGCRGTVFVLCTVPGSEMIPSLKEQKKQQLATVAVDETIHNDKTNTDHAQKDESPSKKRRIEEQQGSNNTVSPKEETNQVVSTEDSKTNTTTPTDAWDPVPIVRQIFQDIAADSDKEAPSSRFVTRMIPIQVTCYTSEEELALASRLLMQHYLPKSTQTFGIALKRRLCHEQLTKEKIITIIAKEVVHVVPTCQVHLDNPEVTIVVEICKTLCGLSIVPACHETFGNFNLAVAREKAHPDDNNDDNDDNED